MRPSTLFLARYIGVFALGMALWMICCRIEAVDLIHGILADRPLAFTWGVFTAAAGLAMVIGHNVWRGGLLPVVVTLVGWLVLFKGLALQLMSTADWEAALVRLHFEADYYAYLAIPLAIGLYLTAAGFLHRGKA